MTRKGGLPALLLHGVFILLAALITAAGVVFVTPTPAPTATPSPRSSGQR